MSLIDYCDPEYTKLKPIFDEIDEIVSKNNNREDKENRLISFNYLIMIKIVRDQIIQMMNLAANKHQKITKTIQTKV